MLVRHDILHGTISDLADTTAGLPEHTHQRPVYDDKLDGKITNNLWEEKGQTLQAQLDETERKLSQAQETAMVPLTTALDMARLTNNACNAFREQNETEQRKLLTTVLKEATWQNDARTN